MTSSKLTLKDTVEEILSSTGNDTIVTLFESDCIKEGQDWNTESDIEFLATLKDKGIEHKYVHSFGGEGMGDDFWSIFEFIKGEDLVLVKFNGWYYSYDGATFSEWYFVKAAVVQEVQYVKLNK